MFGSFCNTSPPFYAENGMQITYKIAALCTLLTAGVAAVDISYCHLGATGTCQGITFATPNMTCYTVNATIGTIDTVLGLTLGVKYSVHTAAGCTAISSSVQFGAGTTTLVTPFRNNVRSISAGTPVVWTPLGCFTDLNASSRTLAAKRLAGILMTTQICQNFCNIGGFGFAGVEFGRECYCDHSIQFPGAAAPAVECNIPCVSNANQTCGGASRINIFSNGQPLPTNPVTVTGPGASTWTYDGCFTDNSIALRTLPIHLEPTTGGVTPQTCVNTCSTAGQTIAGVEFGTECWCGITVNGDATKVADVQCGTACVTNSTVFCGGDNHINIFIKMAV